MAEVASITIDEARALVANLALWPRVRDFLWDFGPSIHESWIDSQTSKLPGREAPNLHTSWRIKKFILDSLGVEPCFHTFPRDDGSRLLLLDGATLESIAKWLGALACAEELRRVTDGATVRALKAALPGVYPGVFGYTEYFRKLKVEKLKVEKLTPQTIVETGVQCLSSIVAHLPQPLLRRLSLKLPRNLELSTSNFQLPTFNFQLSNLQLLLKLRFPEAYKICCS